MNKLIILLILLSYSCTKDKLTNNIQVASSEIDKRSDFSNQLANLLKVDRYVEDQKIQLIYSSIIKSIRPNMSNDSLKKVLQTINYWDQIYRDSLVTKTSDSDEINKRKYKTQISFLDKMNRRIVLYLLNNIGGWPDTKDMGDEASMAIWLVILHNDENKGFSQQVLPHLNKAYHSDSVINNNMYASSFDNINFILNGHSKYGTYPFKKEDHSDSMVNKINLERMKIGLDKI